MKQQYGNIRRTFMEQKPEVYDRKTRIAYMDFTADTQEKTDNASQDTDKAKGKEEKTTIEGFSGFVIQTDGIMDYAHIKSQLVEAAYPQKEEHALAFNTIDALLKKVDGVELTEEESQNLANYKDFSEYRALCANCAHTIIDNLFT